MDPALRFSRASIVYEDGHMLFFGPLDRRGFTAHELERIGAFCRRKRGAKLFVRVA